MSRGRTSDERSFDQAIREQVLGTLRSGPHTLAALVRCAEGAYPADVKHSLSQLIGAGLVRESNYGYVLSSVPGDQALGPRRRLGPQDLHRPLVAMPPPHPADFDWRFTAKSAKRLAHVALKLASGAPICVFGAPTVFLALVSAGADVALVERNPHAVDALVSAGLTRVLRADLLDPGWELMRGYKVVVADPPWYPEHYRAFISRSALALRAGGTLLISVLPRLTRPGATGDRRDLAQIALRCGFEISCYRPGLLHYLTPSFEAASLRAAGIQSDEWRRGDLATFHLHTAVDPTEIRTVGAAPGPDSDGGPWRSFWVGEAHVKVRVRSDRHNSTLTVRPLGGAGAILPTVSRRDPIRDQIDVWTARNEAWSVSRTEVVTRVLEEAARMPLGSALQHVSAECGLRDREATMLRELISQILPSSSDGSASG